MYSKIMYKFCYDYVKLNYREKTKLYHIDTDRFIVHIKAKQIYVDIANYVETKFDTSNYELDRSFIHYLEEKIKK